jgi:hypothetical protein
VRTSCLAALVTPLTFVAFPLSAQSAAPPASAPPASAPALPAPGSAPVAPPAPAPGGQAAPLPTSAPAPGAPAPAPAPAEPAPPVTAAPASPPPATAAPSAPLAPAPPSAGATQQLDPTHEAFVHVASDYPGTWLELKNFVEGGDWQRACEVPCDRKLTVLGIEARVTAPDMSTSNVFRIQPGPGRALVRVDGGSALTRRLGVLGLSIGIPVALTGMAGLSYGTVSDRDGLALAGGIVLGTGGALLLASLPLLLLGTTDVRDARGSQIASDWAFRPAF